MAMAGSIVPLAPPGTGTIALSITDEAGEPVLGNVVIVVQHTARGQTWRGIQYHRATRLYRYRYMPPGSYSIRVVAVGFEPVTIAATLMAGETVTLDVALRRPAAMPLLLLDIRPELQVFRRFTSLLGADPALRARFCAAPQEVLAEYFSRLPKGRGRPDGATPPFSLSTRLFAALLDDGAVTHALTVQRARLAVPDGLGAWMREQILDAWTFRVDDAQGDATIAGVVGGRLRIFALVQAVFMNPVVQSFVPGVTAEEVAKQTIRVLSSLDSPHMDIVAPLLMGMMAPQVAVVEGFARGLLRLFDARVPRGYAVRAEKCVISDGEECDKRTAWALELASALPQPLTGSWRDERPPALSDSGTSRRRPPSHLPALAAAADILAMAIRVPQVGGVGRPAGGELP